MESRSTGRCAISLLLAVLATAACDTSASLDVQPAPTTGEAGRCATCHMAEFKSAGGHEGRRPTTCGVCHGDSSWQPPRRKHDWPLTGAHGSADCFACHIGKPPEFRGTSTACFDCHGPDYEGARSHRARRYSTVCDDCHTTESWSGARAPEAIVKPVPTTPPTSTKPVPTTPPTSPTTKPTTRPTVDPKPLPTHTPKPDVTSHASGHR